MHKHPISMKDGSHNECKYHNTPPRDSALHSQDPEATAIPVNRNSTQAFTTPEETIVNAKF